MVEDKGRAEQASPAAQPTTTVTHTTEHWWQNPAWWAVVIAAVTMLSGGAWALWEEFNPEPWEEIAKNQLALSKILSEQMKNQSDDIKKYQEDIEDLVNLIYELGETLPDKRSRLASAMRQVRGGSTRELEIVLENLGKSAEKMNRKKEASKLFSNNAFIIRFRDVEKGKESYKKALALDSTNLKAWGQLAGLLEQTGNSEEAIDVYRNYQRSAIDQGNQRLAEEATAKIRELATRIKKPGNNFATGSVEDSPIKSYTVPERGVDSLIKPYTVPERGVDSLIKPYTVPERGIDSLIKPYTVPGIGGGSLINPDTRQ